MASGSKMSLKIVVDIKAKKVVFAEAGKDFVNFIFHIMTLPLATVSKILKLQKKDSVGSLGNLYQSIESLDPLCFEPDLNTDSVLRPKLSVCVPLLSFYDVPTSLKIYKCVKHEYISDCGGVGCPACGFIGRVLMPELGRCYVTPTKENIYHSTTKNYVKGGASYVVTDGLVIKPMSFTVITSLVKDFDTLVERQVQIGEQEGLAILKASMENQAVLTTVFLEKKI